MADLFEIGSRLGLTPDPVKVGQVVGLAGRTTSLPVISCRVAPPVVKVTARVTAVSAGITIVSVTVVSAGITVVSAARVPKVREASSVLLRLVFEVGVVAEIPSDPVEFFP